MIIGCKGTDYRHEIQTCSKVYNDYSRYFVILPLSWSREISQTLVLYSGAPLPRSRCEELCLAPMAEENTSLLGTPFTMSVDLRGYGCTTGVSAFDRSSTIKALVAGNLNPSEFARPGHVFPLYGAENGVLERNGHTEATLDLSTKMKPADSQAFPTKGMLRRLFFIPAMIKQT